MRAPIAPAHILQTGEIRAERAAGLVLVPGDAFFGLRDLALELEDRLLDIAELVVLALEARDFQRLQRLAVLLQLHPVPGDPAIGVGHTLSPRITTDSRQNIAWRRARNVPGMSRGFGSHLAPLAGRGIGRLRRPSLRTPKRGFGYVAS